MALGDWWAVGIGRRTVELVTKPAVLILLIAAALLLDPESPTQRGWFVAALGLSLAGDIALLGRGTRWFGAGLVAFLLAHLAYVAGLLVEPGPGGSGVIGLGLVAVAGALVGVPIVTGAGRRHGTAMAVAVTAYLVAISATVVAADAVGDPVARIGAVALYASDGVLGWNRFVRPIPHGRLLTRIPYHVGQALMVVSLLA